MPSSYWLKYFLQLLVLTNQIDLSVKRPSQGKLKLANSVVLENFEKLTNSFLHTSNSCQINNKHGNLQHGRFSSVVALTYNSETEEKKRRNRKRWRNRKVWTKPSLSTRSSVLFCLFLFVSLWAKDETSQTARQL